MKVICISFAKQHYIFLWVFFLDECHILDWSNFSASLKVHYITLMFLIPFWFFINKSNYFFIINILLILIKIFQIIRFVACPMKLRIGYLLTSNVYLNVSKSCGTRKFSFVTNRAHKLANPFSLVVQIELSSSKVASEIT